MTKPPVVALINSSPDVVDMIRIAMEHAGIVLVSTMTHEVRDGEVDIEAFVRQHDPLVVLYDIAPPYDANWLLFQHICGMPPLRDRHFIITTTNERHVRGLVGNQRLFEIVGKPYDLQLLVTAVKEALDARGQSPGSGAPGSPEG
jgi:DNA-binding NtrC family response regulator